MLIIFPQKVCVPVCVCVCVCVEMRASVCVLVAGRAVPLEESGRYALRSGRTRAQMQQHVVRDATSQLRREWTRQKLLLRAAAANELQSRPSQSSARAERSRVKHELSLQKRAFYDELHQKQTAERAAVKELKVKGKKEEKEKKKREKRKKKKKKN